VITTGLAEAERIGETPSDAGAPLRRGSRALFAASATFCGVASASGCSALSPYLGDLGARSA